MTPVHLSIDDMRRAAATMLVDRTTLRVSTAFHAAGIPHVVLKGPAIADWLYGRDELRVYYDSDFLVPPGEWERAGAVLEGMGFEDRLATMGHPRMESLHSYPWGNDDARDADVDLHATLEGLDAAPEDVWAVLSAETVPHLLARRELAVLSPAARAMHVALHVAQHRRGHPVEDLERALARVPESTWERAAALAAELDGTAAFSSGLCALPAGRGLAARLGVAAATSAHTSLRAAQVPLAEGLYELHRARDARTRIAIVRQEVFPAPQFLRWWTPIARHGRLGLVAAYLWRPLYLVSKLPRAGLALWAARRDQRRA
jgi:hypothetical protein